MAQIPVMLARVSLAASSPAEETKGMIAPVAKIDRQQPRIEESPKNVR
jgi:hypothetical protein